jgi:PhnB protein
MQLVPYLNFDGDCREAFEFYRDVLNGDIVAIMTWGESPMCAELPADSHARVMHVHLQAGNAMLMGADGPPSQPPDGTGTYVNINVDEPDEAERIWQALGAGADVKMPLQETFWARRFGMLVDRFGKPWMINCMAAMDATEESGKARDVA